MHGRMQKIRNVCTIMYLKKVSERLTGAIGESINYYLRIMADIYTHLGKSSLDPNLTFL